MRLSIGIVGAGPAGTACAIALAGHGHDVTIFEKMTPPRDKTCGDALIPDAIRCLERLGLFAEIVPHLFPVSRLRFFSPSGLSVDAEGDIYTCRRYRFDSLLLDAACARGARLVVGDVVEVGQEPDAAYIRCRDAGKAHFDFVVGASGASGKSLSLYGVEYRPLPSAYAMRQYVDLPEPHGMDCLEIFYNREILPGYGWIFPVGPRAFNVGVGLTVGKGQRRSNLRQIYEAFVAGNAHCRAILTDSTYRSELQGAPLRTGLRGAAFVKGRVLLSGEAIGATYAMTGEGIGKAMETGIVAAETLHAVCGEDGRNAADGLGARYAAALEQTMRRKFTSYDRAQKWMSYPWVVNLVARRARARADVRDALAGVLAETRDPTEVLSLRGLASLMLKM